MCRIRSSAARRGSPRLGRFAVAILASWIPVAAPAAAGEAPARILRVAPSDAPLARPTQDRFTSLGEALARAAELRRRGTGAPIVIALEPGLHRLAQAVRIGPEHGGTREAPLVIRGAPDGTSRLAGSLPLPPAPMPADLSARLPAAARGQVRAYRLPETLRREPRFRQTNRLGERSAQAMEVFDRGGALHPARWPNEGDATVVPVAGAGSPAFAFKDPPGRSWEHEPDLWAEGFWQWDWLRETIPVERVDGRGGLTLAEPPYEGVKSGGRAVVLHALSELDAPGEWWRDGRRGLLLAWPAAGGPDLEASVAESLIVAEGARHVAIENLRLERARGDLVVVRGGADIVIRHSDLGWAAGRAAVFEGVAGGGLDGCTIHDIGAAAIRLVGGDRAALVPGGLFVRDSRLTRFARLAPTQNPAIDVDGVGAQVVGNYIHDAVGYAVHLRGNDHLFARNEVARLLYGLSDSGAIYAGRDWTARGSAIRENYVHDVTPAPGFEVKGVYLDDMASGFSVSRNLFVGVQKPVFVGGGSDNAITDNVFVASSPAVSLDSRGETWMAAAVSDPHSEVRAAYAAVPVASARWRERYPGLAALLSDEPTVARNNEITGNLIINGRDLFFEQEGDPRRQTILFNTLLDLPGLAAPDALARALADGRVARRMDPAGMRRDTLLERPFRAP
ncbi:right-handed parallel beta-helix repeat-containing protein [Methylobacterium sp. ID0610]|uniref:right-handed parallel beta-helix repeat-containing protein n=1 Tax=Methylobacterium carpenticola TaxID=3344827 RepID=UPI003687FEC3